MNLNLGGYILKICQTGMHGGTGRLVFFIIYNLYCMHNIQKTASGKSNKNETELFPHEFYFKLPNNEKN
jgi:hypothetical protein